MDKQGYRRFPTVWVLVAFGLILVLVVALMVGAATMSNRFKRKAYLAFGYAEYAGRATAEYDGTKVALGSKNITSLYEQTTSGMPMPTLRRGDPAQAVQVDLGEGNRVELFPTEDDNGILVSFTTEGKTQRFLVRGNARFNLICRIVSPAGLMEANTVIEG